jgi:hypothetical protein
MSDVRMLPDPAQRMGDTHKRVLELINWLES